MKDKKNKFLKLIKFMSESDVFYFRKELFETKETYVSQLLDAVLDELLEDAA